MSSTIPVISWKNIQDSSTLSSESQGIYVSSKEKNNVCYLCHTNNLIQSRNLRLFQSATRSIKMYLRKKMQTYFFNIVRMIAQLIFRKVFNRRLNQSIINLITNLLSFGNILMKILPRISFDIPSLQQAHLSSLLRKKMVHFECVLTIVALTRLQLKISIHCHSFLDFLISLVKPRFIQKSTFEELIIWFR
jgi:hypothetical protein